ncbi:MAG TPA: AAA family ATPase [Mycobacteriales bacterium]|nr:AAA family ATPase [Mycobacteriales bacterium]
MLYGRLDRLRERASGWLRETLIGGVATPDQGMSERDSSAASWARRVSQLDAAENGLVFGRLDLEDGEARYIGRLGIVDDDGDYEPLLLDWRAPAARPFYVATAVRPEGVRRRRHIRTRLREVTRVDDEVLDLTDPAAATDTGPAGEAALLAALGAVRTGRMSDIVETIQAEQDHVIRAPHGGVLVVQGGAGTGKTAVALHRAAYLLYTYREQLEKRGVLVVGPNSTFLRYIGEVLPALGETAVVLAPVSGLFPGITADRPEAEDVAEVKGRAEMADVLTNAVQDRQHVPDGALVLHIDGEKIRIPAAAIRRARTAARRTRRPHNEARPVFVEQFVATVAAEYAADLGERSGAGRSLAGIAGELDLDLLVDQMGDNDAVLDALDELWPSLTPQRFLAELLLSADRLVAAGLSEVDAELIRRDPDSGWTAADVPLLDEAAELLGIDDRATRALESARRRQEIEQAQDVLDILAGSETQEADDLGDLENADRLSAGDLIDAARLAERHEELDDRELAERASDDRLWTYGHVVVDEAQELSAMAWRLLMRRCPSRSMTLVGDVAQTSDLAGASSWQQVLEPYVGRRFRLEELTVNYRNPAELMVVAAGVLAALDPPVTPPRSVRETGEYPWTAPYEPGTLPDHVKAEREVVGEGRVAVIVPAAKAAEVRESLQVAEDPDLTEPVVVLTVRQVKGLEFDSVLVVDPAGILAESPRGTNDLYVALTRSTRRLGVLPDGPLPDMLSALDEPVAAAS